MATIFQYPLPTGGATSNCAVLANGENYYAPFAANIGSNWNQIRVSAYLGICGTSGFQSFPTTETINTTSANLSFHWGVGTFVSNLGLSVPLSLGCNFAGISTFPSTTTCINLANSINSAGNSTICNAQGGLLIGAIAANGATSSTIANFGANISVVTQPTLNTGAFNYCVPMTMVFQMFTGGQTGQKIGILLSVDETGGAQNPNSASTPDIQALRSAANNLAASGQLSIGMKTFYYTSGLLPTGGPLPLPDTVFFHWPFKNNLLRIHGLLVEKYA